MRTFLWLSIPTSHVEISKLVPCQEHLIEGWQPGNSYSGDPFPHIVYYGNCYFISDGHHRINHAKVNGHETIEARVLYKIDGKTLIELSKTGYLWRTLNQ